MQLKKNKKKTKNGLCHVWDLSLENIFYNRLLFWKEFKFVIKLLLNHATWVKQKTKTWVVWDLSLENFDNRLLVWIKFKFVLNYF